MMPPIPQHLLTCRCGHYTVGFELSAVQEVLTEQDITRVPRAPANVLGLLNLRGNVVPAISLHQALGVTGPPLAESPHRHIILSLSQSTVSLVVDDVGEVLDLDDSRYFVDVAGLSQLLRDVTLGIYTSSHGAVLHLDPESTCRTDTEVHL